VSLLGDGTVEMGGSLAITYGLSAVSRRKIIIIICTREANGAVFWSMNQMDSTSEKKRKGKGQPSLARCGEPSL